MSLSVVPMTERPPTPAWLTEWAAFAANVRWEDLPPAVTERAVQVMYDSVGAIAAGAQEPETRALADRLAPAGDGGVAPVIGTHRHAPAATAALLNGVAGTMLELDEGNQYSRGHPGIHVVPAILAYASTHAVSGRDLLLALALGYEIGARIGTASKLRVTMHPHGTWGTVGAAVAVARLAGATAEQMVEVINVSSTLGLATSRRTMLEGGTVRNTFAGWSNQIGLTVWDLVASGFTGEADGLATIFGTVAADDWTPAAMTEELGTRWEIARNYFKRHACCRYNHAALDALEKIKAELGTALRAEDVDAIEVDTYIWAAQLAGPAPHNTLAAKFSLPYSLATHIVHGAASVEAFRAEALTNETTRALARRVTLRESKEYTAMLPALRPARVTVKFKDGRTLSAESLTNRGDTEDPYTTADVEAKFLALATPVWGDTHAQTLLQATQQLPAQADLVDYLALLAR